jgi:serine/threonine protein phosphatase PrpC
MSSTSALRIDSLSFTHSGGRDYNEDSLAECEAFGAVRLFMLADGAGGQGGGDVASKLAVVAAREVFLGLPVFSPDTLSLCMEKADEAICAKQKSEPRLAQMASTFVALLVNYERGQALVGNLGDSRCYIFRGGKVIGQSYDHSLVQRFVDAGLYPLEKLREHPRRNVLYASLGANSEEIPPFTTQSPIDLQPGDAAMLCSDGVWELLEDATLVELASTSASLDDWRDRLQSLVKSSMPSGHDNFSAILIKAYMPDKNQDSGRELNTVRPLIPNKLR